MTNIDSSRYKISVKKITDDGVDYYEAKVKELPDVAEYSDTVEKAYALALNTIETAAEVFEEEGRPFPSPQPDIDDYSGRVTLRMAKTLHRDLSERAEEEGLSLNAFLNSALSYFTGAARRLELVQTTIYVPTKEVEKVVSLSNVVDIISRKQTTEWPAVAP